MGSMPATTSSFGNVACLLKLLVLRYLIEKDYKEISSALAVDSRSSETIFSVKKCYTVDLFTCYFDRAN